MIDLKLVQFCARECELQMSGERSVAWMIQAWICAQDLSNYFGEYRHPTVEDVILLGKLVEPVENERGFRRVGVRVGWDVKMDWQEVPRQIDLLMEAITHPPIKDLDKGISFPAVSPEQFFKQYEEIHPFRDGNGRTGLILYNWLNKTLDNPVWAPNFWHDPRRRPEDGAP